MRYTALGKDILLRNNIVSALAWATPPRLMCFDACICCNTDIYIVGKEDSNAMYTAYVLAPKLCMLQLNRMEDLCKSREAGGLVVEASKLQDSSRLRCVSHHI